MARQFTPRSRGKLAPKNGPPFFHVFNHVNLYLTQHATFRTLMNKKHPHAKILKKSLSVIFFLIGKWKLRHIAPVSPISSYYYQIIVDEIEKKKLKKTSINLIRVICIVIIFYSRKIPWNLKKTFSLELMFMPFSLNLYLYRNYFLFKKDSVEFKKPFLEH